MSKNVIVVAHADDEAIWCSSLPLRYDGVWTVICCSTPVKGPERATVEFFKSCRVIGANGILITGITDKGKDDPLDESLYPRIAPHLHGADVIFTHNEDGEYGHIHHKAVHQYIKKNFSTLQQVNYFGYSSTHEFPGLAHRGSVDWFSHELSAEEENRKSEALKCYKHIERTKPYYNSIHNWLTKLPRYNIHRESFYGIQPRQIL